MLFRSAKSLRQASVPSTSIRNVGLSFANTAIEHAISTIMDAVFFMYFLPHPSMGNNKPRSFHTAPRNENSIAETALFSVTGKTLSMARRPHSSARWGHIRAILSQAGCANWEVGLRWKLEGWTCQPGGAIPRGRRSFRCRWSARRATVYFSNSEIMLPSTVAPISMLI